MTTPTLSQVIRTAITTALREAHIAIPGRVVSYDASKARVDVKPAIKVPYEDESGARRVEELPVLPKVPVVFPGMGSYRITFPIAKGDTVLLVFSEASLDKWLSEGGVVDPSDDRRNHLSDAVAIPGLYDFKNVASAGEDAMALEAPEIRLGSHDASDPVALKSDLDALKTWLNTHTHPTVGAPSTPWGGATGSTKVKAE